MSKRPRLSFAWTRSLRFRLTAWYTLFLSLILISAGLAAYHATERIILHETDGYLSLEARRIVSAAAEDDSGHGDWSELREAIGTMQGGAVKSHLLPGFILFDGIYGRVVDPRDHQTIAATRNLTLSPNLIPSMDEIMRPSSGEGSISRAFAGPDEEHTMRALTQTIAVRNRPLVLQLAVPWDNNEDALERLGLMLCLLIPILLSISALGSWVVVGRTLQPIGRIVADVERADIRTLSGALLPVPAETDSEVGRLVMTLNGMAARMHGALETQRRFSADASHELRTPLTFLRGEIEYTLMRPREKETYRAALENAVTAIDELGRIVQSLSYLARMDSGELDLPQTSPLIDIPAVVSGMAQEQESEARRKSILLTAEHSEKIYARGNEEQLRLMMRNLIENALKYTAEDGSVALTVSLVRTDGYQEVEIAVADTGIGIAADEIEHVFERFWRAPRARSTAGSGLGLSIAAQIAAAHGGHITVQSVVGQGSVFTVSIPAAG